MINKVDGFFSKMIAIIIAMLLLIPFIITGMIRGIFDGLLFWFYHHVYFKGFKYWDKMFIKYNKGFYISEDSYIYHKL